MTRADLAGQLHEVVHCLQRQTGMNSVHAAVVIHVQEMVVEHIWEPIQIFCEELRSTLETSDAAQV